jgi:hypothetical protein
VSRPLNYFKDQLMYIDIEGRSQNNIKTLFEAVLGLFKQSALPPHKMNLLFCHKELTHQICRSHRKTRLTKELALTDQKHKEKPWNDEVNRYPSRTRKEKYTCQNCNEELDSGIIISKVFEHDLMLITTKNRRTKNHSNMQVYTRSQEPSRVHI